MVDRPIDDRPDDADGIWSLDNVHLDLPVAGVGSRSLALMIDMILLSAILFVWWMGGAILGSSLMKFGFGWIIALLVLGSFLLQWGYFAALEIFLQGRTLGKQAVGLRVVSRDGGRPSVGAFLIRNFLRNFDLLIGLPLMLIDRRSRRLGDQVAGTFVVHLREESSDAGDEVRLGRVPISWGAREIAVVESFLRRAPRMEKTRAGELAQRLISWIDREDPAFVAEVETRGVAEIEPGIDRVLILRRLLAAESNG